MAIPSKKEEVKKLSPEERLELSKLLQESEADDLRELKAGFIERIHAVFNEAVSKGFTLTQADVSFIRGKQGKASKSDDGATRVGKFFYAIGGVNYPFGGRKSKEFNAMNLTEAEKLKAKVANPEHPQYEANKRLLEKEKKGGVVAKKAPAKAPVKVAKKAPVNKVK